MKNYDVHLSVDCGIKSDIKHPILNDRWKSLTVNASNVNEAIRSARRIEEEKGNRVNYILSCEEVVCWGR